jgi:hypothetical protein
VAKPVQAAEVGESTGLEDGSQVELDVGARAGVVEVAQQAQHLAVGEQAPALRGGVEEPLQFVVSGPLATGRWAVKVEIRDQQERGSIGAIPAEVGDRPRAVAGRKVRPLEDRLEP